MKSAPVGLAILMALVGVGTIPASVEAQEYNVSFIAGNLKIIIEEWEGVRQDPAGDLVELVRVRFRPAPSLFFSAPSDIGWFHCSNPPPEALFCWDAVVIQRSVVRDPDSPIRLGFGCIIVEDADGTDLFGTPFVGTIPHGTPTTQGCG